jgi:hypothetical protein
MDSFSMVRILMLVETPEVQQTQSHVIFLETSPTSCGAKCGRASSVSRFSGITLTNGRLAHQLG